MVTALASEEVWPLADIRGFGNYLWNFIFYPKPNLLPEVLSSRTRSATDAVRF